MLRVSEAYRKTVPSLRDECSLKKASGLGSDKLKFGRDPRTETDKVANHEDVKKAKDPDGQKGT